MPLSAAGAAPLGTAIPKAPLLDTLRALLGGKSERIDMLSRLQRLHDEKGPVVAQSAGVFQMVHLFGPDANRFVLLDRDRIFSSRKPWMMIMGRIFPNGLLLRDGDEHKLHRKIMHEAFTRPALRDYLERMNPMIERGLGRWRQSADRRDGFLAFRGFKELTLDIAASIFVGVDLGPETRRMNGVFEDLVAAAMSRIRLPIPGLEFQRGLKGREFMIAYFRRLIPERRAGGGDDMFSRLCRAESEEGARFTDADVIDHMIFLMMAAHDTTTSTLTSMTYELARHPDWQERLRDESRALAKAQIDVDRLDGLTWVMKETLRRYPPLPVIPRVAVQDFEWGGYGVRGGSMVVASPIHTHHMPEWWPEPQRFDPERFTPARAEDEKHTHCWVPFGGGAHLCIGYRFAEVQVKSIMHQLLLRHRWSLPEGYRMPVQQAPISKPLDGLPIRLEPV